ncbi:MAG: lysophospholipid acyltransferase family protein [Acidobacteriota bacterium]
MAEPSLSPGDRAKAMAIAAVGYPLIAGLCRTFRWRVEGAEHWDEVRRSGKQPILAVWHGRIFAGLHYFRDRGVVVITSRNFDGEWIARILHRFGFGTARGSSSRGAVRALVELRRALGSQKPAAFTLDGPRGPARVAQPGAVWLAGATQNPLLPYHIEASRYWTVRSWDRTQIPKPFSIVAIAIGAPIHVNGTTPASLADGRVQLEAALNGLEQRALGMLREP